jgi:aminomethyltransferase
MALRTPLYDWHLSHGARLVEFGGWDMPVQYSSIVEEHAAVRTAAGLFDISHMGRLSFQGPDALALIQRVWTNDAASMSVGQVRYGLLCNENGGILDDVLVYRFEPFWLMVVNASNREKVLRWLEQQRTGRDVLMRDLTTSTAMLAIQGPRAADVTAAALAGDEWDAVGASAAALKYYYACYAEVPAPGHRDRADRVFVSRTGYTGEDGFEVILRAEQAVAFWERLRAAARQIGVNLEPCGLGARDTLRLEAAMPLYGHELDEKTDPYQAGLGWAVKPNKGDFIGRDALLRRREDPALPKRVGLELEGKRIAREGSAVLIDGRTIGRVTSGTFSPTLRKALAMAYVEPTCATVGTPCMVDVRGKPEPARVVPLPFYRRATQG